MIENQEKFPQTLAELGGFIARNQDKLVKHAFFRLGTLFLMYSEWFIIHVSIP
jgi:hypothetical protein